MDGSIYDYKGVETNEELRKLRNDVELNDCIADFWRVATKNGDFEGMLMTEAQYQGGSNWLL
jgi:hypothetical protein